MEEKFKTTEYRDDAELKQSAPETAPIPAEEIPQEKPADAFPEEAAGTVPGEAEQENDRFKTLEESMTELHRKLDKKIADDEYKERIIDKMHEELDGYRNGLADRPLEEAAMDIIQMNDNLKKSAARYRDAEPTEENYKKILEVLDGIIEDHNDLLYRQGIEAYSVEGDRVDIKRQKTIGIIETDDESLHNRVAERTACGYEKNGKIIRPERIKTYRYIPNDEQSSQAEDKKIINK